MAKTANIFDQFDGPAKGGGNVFDQFDENQPKENAATFETTDVVSTAKRLPFTPDSELSSEARQARQDYLLSNQGSSIVGNEIGNLHPKMTAQQTMEAALPLYRDLGKAFPALGVASGLGQTVAGKRFSEKLPGFLETLMAASPEGVAFNYANEGLDRFAPKAASVVNDLLSAPSLATKAITGQKELTPLQKDVLAVPNLAFQTALFGLLHEAAGKAFKIGGENASSIEEAARGNGNRGASPEQTVQAEPGSAENVAPATSRLRGDEGEAAPGVKAQSKQGAPDEGRRVQPPLQAGPGKAEAIRIPQFTRAEDAEAFGRSNPAMAPRLEKELRTARRDEAEVLKLYKEKKVSAGILANVSFRAQMLNEALDYAKNPDKANPFGEKLGATETVKPDLRGKVTEAEKAATQATGTGETTAAAQAPAERLAGPVQESPPSPMPGQAVPEHGVGAATAKEFTPAKQTVNILSRVKRSVSESTGSVKDAKDAMLQHHRLVRDARFNTLSLGKELDALADGDGQVAKRLGIKAEGKAEIPPERRMLLIHAFQQPDKYGSLLTPYEKQVVDHFRRIAKAEQIYAENSGVIDPETVKKNPNYLFQWWMNEKTGEPYSPMYGQFSKGAPQMHEKFYQNYEEGIKAGKIPATDNLGTLVGYGVEGITRAAETRNMFKSLSSIEADVDGSLLRSRRSTEAKPLRMLESWARLKDQGMTNGYVRYDHPALDKAIVFKLKDGTLMRVQGPVGVREEIFPFVKAYFESPSYKTLGHLVFSFKTLKLMGGFHIWSLNFQALAGSPGVAKIPVYNVIAGLRTIKDLGDNLRVLYRNGLALKGFEDTGDFQGGLKRMAASEKWPIRWIGKGLNASADFTFNVVHPAIKAFTANHVYEDLKSKMESGLGRDLTESEKNEVAKQSVKYADALFSGGDYRSQLLQTNEWMAKHYYSPEARKAWQMTLLSPEWQKEHLVMLKDVIKSISTERNKPEAYLYRRYLYGALSIYATANLYNWVMTKYMDGDGKLMIQNPSAFTVRAPWNTNGGQPVYMHPLKSIFEVPEFLSDPIGKLLNKLAPIPRTMGDAYLDIKSGAPTKKTITDAIENVGVPISGVQLFDPNQPLASQVASVAGLPAYPKTYVSQIYQKADEWQKKHGYPVRNINPAGEPSPYRDLRTALENGRMDAARDAYDQLRKGTALSAPKSSKGIAEYFAEYARRPFTGSYAKDRAFYRSLSTADKKVYDEAKKERERVRKAFFDLMRRRTITKRKRESKNAD